MQLDRIAHKAFFGDMLHMFALGPQQVAELEKLTGFGIGAIFQRVLRQQFSQVEVLQTLRLGLIGGGVSPDRAFDLVATYAESYPLETTYVIALDTLNALWFGNKPKTEEAVQ